MKYNPETPAKFTEYQFSLYTMHHLNHAQIIAPLREMSLASVVFVVLNKPKNLSNRYVLL